MQIFRSLDELAGNTLRSVVSVGNFDGVPSAINSC